MLLYDTWAFVLGFHLVYLIFSLFVLIGFLYGSGRSGIPEDNKDDRDDIAAIGAGENEMNPQKRASLTKTFQKLVTHFRLPGEKSKTESTKRIGHEFSLWNTTTVILAFILKTAVIFLLMPILLFVFMQVVLLGIMLVLLVLGYPVIGVFVISLGALLSCFAFIWLIWDILFTKKVRNEN